MIPQTDLSAEMRKMATQEKNLPKEGKRHPYAKDDALEVWIVHLYISLAHNVLCVYKFLLVYIYMYIGFEAEFDDLSWYRVLLYSPCCMFRKVIWNKLSNLQEVNKNKIKTKQQQGCIHLSMHLKIILSKNIGIFPFAFRIFHVKQVFGICFCFICP